MKRLELLSPARNAEVAFAAIDHGADAIYIGASGFGARQAATNSLEDIARTVEYAHRYGVRVYSTLNTVIFERELASAERLAREVVSTGVDALIIQDMAFTQMNLGVELHASTQMFNTSGEGVKFLQDAGFKRVVLERGLTLSQIQAIASQAPRVELEAFIHGAICVGMSGRCYLSKALSPRSGNRGECMQACRLNFDLEGQSGRKIITGKHLLSVKDMNLSEHIASLIDAGVSSFKIEGRLKDIVYTKNIVSHYRQIIDKEISQRSDIQCSSQGESKISFTPNPAKSFSRGQSCYLLDGMQSGLASFNSPKATGEEIGRVESVTKGGFTLSGRERVSPGDGVCYLSEGKIVGTNVNAVNGREIVPNRRDNLRIGESIYRNFDKLFNDQLEQRCAERKIDIRATIKIDKSGVALSYLDSYENSATREIFTELEPAKNPEKMVDIIKTQLSKSGDTEFRVVDIEIIGEPLFIASSQLSQLRREALLSLREQRLKSLEPNTPFVENRDVIYPTTTLSGEGNVTNSLARKFYSSHGVTQIDKGWDVASSLSGARLMQSRYCIRHEIGECLKEGSKLTEELFLVHGRDRFKLEFNCKKCQMNIYKI
ncbi:MAG: U32 family peptidase [Rikenellaceae bacterium]